MLINAKLSNEKILEILAEAKKHLDKAEYLMEGIEYRLSNRLVKAA